MEICFEIIDPDEHLFIKWSLYKEVVSLSTMKQVHS